MQNNKNIHCLILAGGKARRFDGLDKGLIKVNKIRLIDHAINNIQPQVSDIIISANRNLQEYEKLGFPVLTDNNDNFDGPLAGILRALEHINDGVLAVIPCDMPVINKDLISRLFQQLSVTQADICCVNDQTGLQPLLAIMHQRVLHSLQEYLQAGHHKVMDWVTQQNLATLDTDNTSSLLNINDMNDIKLFEASNHD